MNEATPKFFCEPCPVPVWSHTELCDPRSHCSRSRRWLFIPGIVQTWCEAAALILLTSLFQHKYWHVQQDVDSHVTCIRPGTWIYMCERLLPLLQARNIQVNMTDILWLLRGPSTTIRGGLRWQSVVNPGVEHSLSVRGPHSTFVSKPVNFQKIINHLCLTPSHVFFFIVVVVPLEIRLHGCTLRRTGILRVSRCQLCWRHFKGASVIWPLDLAGRQS